MAEKGQYYFGGLSFIQYEILKYFDAAISFSTIEGQNLIKVKIKVHILLNHLGAR